MTMGIAKSNGYKDHNQVCWDLICGAFGHWSLAEKYGPERFGSHQNRDSN